MTRKIDASDFLPKPDYVEKVPHFNAPADMELLSVRGLPDFREKLVEAGLTRGQRAAVDRIVGNAAFLNHNLITVGEYRKMNLEQKSQLGTEIGRGWSPRAKSIQVLDKLIG